MASKCGAWGREEAGEDQAAEEAERFINKQDRKKEREGSLGDSPSGGYTHRYRQELEAVVVLALIGPRELVETHRFGGGMES